ncbi:MAG: DUF748 domain-containing protein [Salinisphaera sp.]|jgi:outer membrane protein OmpA-like peptidoglycan-associated protein|nr:DUF748 domain-containing protein [Salinisphaera sp.]
MKLSRSAWRALAGFGLLIVVLGAIAVFAPPVVVRYALLHYLQSQGIDATIENVDANLFTGHIAIDSARGRRDHRTVFDIGHLALNLRYPPLWDKKVALSHLSISNSSLGVRHTAGGAIRVGGVPLISNSQAPGSGASWTFGLSQLSIAQVTVHYSRPKSPAYQAVTQDVVVNKLRMSNIEPWQRKARVTLNADLAAGKSDVRIAGHATPFASSKKAELQLHTTDLHLAVLASLIRTQRLGQLDGQIDSHQQIDMSYKANHGLHVDLNGSVDWQDAGYARANGLAVKSQNLGWTGTSHADLLRANKQPGRIELDGSLHVAQLETRQPGTLDFHQADGHWKGRAEATLGSAIQLDTQGTLSTADTRLNSPGRLSLAAERSTLEGKLNLRFGAKDSQIDTAGNLSAKGMTFSVPDSLKFTSQTWDWHGKSETRLGGPATRITTNGHVSGTALALNVPGTGQFKANAVNWQGEADIHSAGLFARKADGQLTLSQPTLDMTSVPLSIDADRLVYDGHYAQQPDAAGHALRLSMNGAIDSHKMHVVDTAIDAPWFSALELHGANLSIDGLDQIQLASLKASGVRLLGDTNTSSSVLNAVSLTAQSIKLSQLAHYSFGKVSIDDADIHVRRTPSGMGVISLFLGSGSKSSSGAGQPSQSSPHTRRSTLAVKHLALSGPAATFVDTAVTPNVKLNGSDLNFTLEDLDTAKPAHEASYRLSLNVGAYGHLNSRGQIAPLAPNGINMNLDAWLRSLAMAPLSGYLNAAMRRKIANGAADGTMHLKATHGQLDGTLKTTLSNFRLAGGEQAETNIALGISLDSALTLVRGQNDVINFKTRILGDVTNPYFSIRNLVREAVLAGLRTALLSDYSPVGLLNKAKNAFLNLFRSVSDRPAIFEAGRHYIRPEDREYMGRIAQAMVSQPGWDLIVQGHANPSDAKAMALFKGQNTSQGGKQVTLRQLARMRGQAVRDYLAARNVNPDRIRLQKPVVDNSANAKPRATFKADKSPQN